MSGSIFLDRIFFTGPYRLSRDFNTYDIPVERTRVPDDDMETKHSKIILGEQTAEMTFRGRASGPRDVVLYQYLLNEDVIPVLAQFGSTRAVGDDAAFLEGKLYTVKPQGARNERAEIEFMMAQASRFYLLRWLYQTIGGAGLTAAGNGTGLELGALDEGQELVVVVVNPDYPASEGTAETADGRLVSAVDNTFAGAVQRVVFDQITATPDFAVYRVDGDVTQISDPWWRVEWTGVGGTGSPRLWPVVAGKIVDKL